MDTSWMKKVNDILRRHRIAREGILCRFGATLYPYPTVAVSIYENDEKIAEFSIRDLSGFISDLQTALTIIRMNAEQKRREETNENESESESNGKSEVEKTSETKTYSRRRRRKPKRD